MLTMNGHVRDMRPVECRFFDRNDRMVGKINLPPAGPGSERRRIIFDGKMYIEGDGTGFYGQNEFAEVVEEA